jgi:hypothetical protein
VVLAKLGFNRSSRGSTGREDPATTLIRRALLGKDGGAGLMAMGTTTQVQLQLIAGSERTGGEEDRGGADW